MPTHQRAILITGAAGGVGAATVAAFADRGYRVYAGVRTPANAPKELDRGGVQLVTLDVTDQNSVEAAAQTIAAERGAAGLQAVVNNAGVIVQGPLELVPDDEVHREFDINVYGPLRVLRAFLPLLRQDTGRIVNISAASAHISAPYFGPIAASKAALESLSNALRLELTPWRIPVSVVVPGAMRTQIFAKADEAAAKALADADPERRALYASQLQAVAQAQEKQQLRPVTAVVNSVLHAVESKHPKATYIAGQDARIVSIASKLPAGVRDRLVLGMLGLSGSSR